MSNPATHAESFNGSLGAFSGVDPIRYSSGLWLEEATTNACVRPYADTTATTSWGATTATLDTDGTWFRATRKNPSGGLWLSAASGNRPSAVEGQVWSVGCDMDLTVGMTARLTIGWQSAANGGGSALGTSQSAVITGDGTAKRVIVTGTAPSGTASFIAFIAGPNSGTNGDVIKGRNWQFEQKGYATSVAVGDAGTGYAFTGTAFASTSTRAASSAAISPSGILSPSSGALAFRITPTIETGVEEIWGEVGVKGSGTDHVRWGRDASKHPFVEWSANNASYQRLTGSETLNALTAYDLYLGHSATTISLAVDAGTLQTGTRDAVEGDFSTGDLTLEASAGGVIYQPFATFNRTLTAKEIATLNGKNNWTMNVLTGNPYINFQLRPY